MCPQAPRLSPEYSHKVGLQTVITGEPSQIGLVIHLVVRGLLQWAEFIMGSRDRRDCMTGHPCQGPSSCGVEDEGWKLLVTSPLWYNELGEGFERRVASGPSPQHSHRQHLICYFCHLHYFLKLLALAH
jgi:hypothetical protein